MKNRIVENSDPEQKLSLVVLPTAGFPTAEVVLPAVYPSFRISKKKIIRRKFVGIRCCFGFSSECRVPTSGGPRFK